MMHPLASVSALAQGVEGERCDAIVRLRHELRTPLSVMLAMAELLQRTELDAEQAWIVEQVLAAGLELRQSMEVAMDQLGMDFLPTQPALGDFEPREILDLVYGHCASRVGGGAVEIGIGVDDSVPNLLVGDAARLERLLVLLLGELVRLAESPAIEMAVASEPADERSIHLRIRLQNRVLEGASQAFHGPGGAGMTARARLEADRLAAGLGGGLQILRSPESGTTVELETRFALPEPSCAPRRPS